MISVHVKEIAFDPSMNPVLLLTDEPEAKVLPIWIGPFEAHAIAMAIEGQQAERPMTHDLLQACCERLGGHIIRVVISDVQDGTYIAELHLETAETHTILDARPSDAITLALKSLAPIYISETVAEHALSMQELVQQSEDDDSQSLFHASTGKRTLH